MQRKKLYKPTKRMSISDFRFPLLSSGTSSFVLDISKALKAPINFSYRENDYQMTSKINEACNTSRSKEKRRLLFACEPFDLIHACQRTEKCKGK